MDDIFSPFLTLTSYINHRIIQFIDDIMSRGLLCWFEDFETISFGQFFTSSSHTNQAFQHDCAIEFPEEGPSVQGDQPFGLLIVNSSHSSRSLHFIFKGLILPIYFFEFSRKWVAAAWRFVLNYARQIRARAHGMVSRVLKTLRGSSDDIGWLQRAPGMAPVIDGSARFQELLQSIRNGMHILPDSFVYLLIPGLFSNHGPLYFVSIKKFFSKMGLACHIAKIHSEASVEHNARELKQYIEELYWGSGKRILLLGHSKGGVDAAAALSIYTQELRSKVAGLVLVQSPYGGTPIASDILREGQLADVETRRIMEFFISVLIKGDIRALEDLTYEKRKEFLQKHKFPDHIPLISFHSEASVAPGVIATMSQIAHAELSWFPRWDRDDSDLSRKVPVIVPVSAAMALCALHLQLRYGEKSDGLVTRRDAEVPGSVVVKPDRKLDHSWMVYSSWTKDQSEPDACDMCEALLTMLVELGAKVQN